MDSIKLVVLHLCAWSQLGALVRLYLGVLFGGACGESGRWQWIPCVTSPGLNRYGGALFTDLPANVLGSFAIGFLSSGDTLAAVFPTVCQPKAPIAALRRTNPLQKQTALHIGLRTGFCGSLTTYSSWMLQMTKMMVGSYPSTMGTQWVAALWGYFIGCATSLVALYMGQHAALALQNRGQHTHLGPPAKVAVAGSTVPQAKPLEELQRVSIKSEPEGIGDNHVQAASVVVIQTSSCQAVTAGASMQQLHKSATPDKSAHFLHWSPSLCAVVVSCVLTGISLGFLIRGAPGGDSQQYIWFGVLFAPFGCLLRWQLSVWNGKLPGSWSWFPIGTFAANQLACLLNFAAAAVLVRVPNLTNVQMAVLQGLIVGIAGALSTVSTWVVEIQKLLLRVHESLHGYVYLMSSIATSAALGLLVYGLPVWIS